MMICSAFIIIPGQQYTADGGVCTSNAWTNWVYDNEMQKINLQDLSISVGKTPVLFSWVFFFLNYNVEFLRFRWFEN